MKLSNIIPALREAITARSLFASLFSLPAACFLVTAIYTLMFYFPLFYFDHWDLLGMVQAIDTGNLTTQHVFKLHGLHWHASGYFLMLLLGEITGYSQLAEVLMSLGLAFIAFLGALKLVKRQINIGSYVPNWTVPTAITALFVFSLDQSQNWLLGWQITVFAHLVGVVWCIEILTRQTLSWRSTSAACVMAAVAIYGFATGWALIPIGFGVLIARKIFYPGEAWKSLAVWALFSVLILWHMILAMAAEAIAQSAAATTGGLENPFYAYGIYALNYVASPVTRFSSDISLFVFVLSGAVALYCIRLVWRSNAISPLKFAPALALMAYAIGAGLLTSFGRLDNFGHGTAFLGRYITFGNMYWLGFMALLFAALQNATGTGRRGIFLALGLLCVLKVATIGNVVGSAVPHAKQVHASVAKVRACYPNLSQEDLAGVFGPSQFARARGQLKYVHDNKLSAFAKSPEPNIVCSPSASSAGQE